MTFYVPVFHWIPMNAGGLVLLIHSLFLSCRYTFYWNLLLMLFFPLSPVSVVLCGLAVLSLKVFLSVRLVGHFYEVEMFLEWSRCLLVDLYSVLSLWFVAPAFAIPTMNARSFSLMSFHLPISWLRFHTNIDCLQCVFKALRWAWVLWDMQIFFCNTQNLHISLKKLFPPNLCSVFKPLASHCSISL